MIQDIEVRYRRGRELDLVGSNGTRSSRVNESASSVGANSLGCETSSYLSHDFMPYIYVLTWDILLFLHSYNMKTSFLKPLHPKLKTLLLLTDG